MDPRPRRDSTTHRGWRWVHVGRSCTLWMDGTIVCGARTLPTVWYPPSLGRCQALQTGPRTWRASTTRTAWRCPPTAPSSLCRTGGTSASASFRLRRGRCSPSRGRAARASETARRLWRASTTPRAWWCLTTAARCLWRTRGTPAFVGSTSPRARWTPLRAARAASTTAWATTRASHSPEESACRKGATRCTSPTPATTASGAWLWLPARRAPSRAARRKA
mmetsp:Transcript_39464/g.75614  ORF Transcript_39464/g.75614 Transcript_39464/m.75614 type:complete len:221 (-) Transcript_39464:1964-2626(-)